MPLLRAALAFSPLSAGGHPAVVVRELVGLEFHAPFAVGHHAVGLAHIRAAAVEQQGHGGGVGTAFLHIEPGAGVPGPLHAGVDCGIQQHKSTGATGPAQAADGVLFGVVQAGKQEQRRAKGQQTKDPNPSPIEKRFGFSLFGADKRT